MITLLPVSEVMIIPEFVNLQSNHTLVGRAFKIKHYFFFFLKRSKKILKYSEIIKVKNAGK